MNEMIGLPRVTEPSISTIQEELHCPICLSVLQTEDLMMDQVCNLKCGHQFHTLCIEKWKIINFLCFFVGEKNV